MMKRIETYLALLCSSILLFSCKPEVKEVAFAIDVEDVAVDRNGGTFDINLSSSEPWTASSDDPWITVSPANGPASAACKVSIDSTVANASRSGLLRFYNTVTGESRDVKFTQDGFGYVMDIVQQPMELEHYANAEVRSFEVKVRTNLPFTVMIPATAISWLSCENPHVELDGGARPREVTLRFKWGVNSIPAPRHAVVTLLPPYEYKESAAQLEIAQKAAPELEPGHDTDSLVIVSLCRNLATMQQVVSAEPMSNWDIVTLWEEGDPGYTPQKKGRVRIAYFSLFQTTEPIPYEVQYLTEAEELTFFSNVNSFLYDMSIGENICKLKNLKRLTVSAYGLATLPDSFANLENLEWLDLSSNNFSTVPEVLTPENFPKLHALMLNTCQRGYIVDLSNTTRTDIAGFHGPFPRKLLEWENLDTLRLSVNFIEGQMPDMEDYPVRYTEEDCKTMSLPPAMVGKPKVLPKAKYFAFNLNRMHGTLPDWVLYHPNLPDWSPYALCYPQEGRASDGTVAAFGNVPVNMDYYWSFYDGYKEHQDIYVGL